MDAKNQGYARGVVSRGKLMDSLAQPITQIQASPAGDDDFQFKVELESESLFHTTEIDALRERYRSFQQITEELLCERERLTNHADTVDYELAAACGVVCGLLDAVFVGELDLTKAHEQGSEAINAFVLRMGKTAQVQDLCKNYKWDKGSYSDLRKKIEAIYANKDTSPEALRRAIQRLEKEFGLASDSVTASFGEGTQHHLRDFAHHPNLHGLFFSLLTQFTGYAYGTDTAGRFITVKITNTKWIGQDLFQKILYGVVFWFLHMVSDMAGSNNHAGQGTGLPGPMLSLAKRLSANPIFTSEDGTNELALFVSKAFNGTLHGADGNRLGVRIDFRTELGAAKQQCWPVILNEMLVRSFYFIRRLMQQMEQVGVATVSGLPQLDVKSCLPFNNRTIVRMATVSSTVFTAIDVADAALHAAEKSGGVPQAFATQMILRVNFIGAGRTVFAVGTDVAMGIQRGHVQDKVEQAVAEELRAYTQLLRAETVELHRIVCWGIEIKFQRVNAITAAIDDGDEAEINRQINRYFAESGIEIESDEDILHAFETGSGLSI